MTKLQFLLLPILFTLFTSEAFASNPMMQVAQVNPIPMLMPVLVKKAAQLELTEEQIAAFAKWRSENMAPAMKASMAIKNGLQSIRKATLDGSSIEKIETMLAQVAQARADLADRTLRCHAYARRILSNNQWKKVIDLYGKQK